MWWSEAKTPSRLGEAVVNVLLAVWKGDEIRPLFEGPHAWAYSGVRVPERLVSRAAEPTNPSRQVALARLMEALPGEGKWSVVLALDEREQRLIGEALSKPHGNRPEELRRWEYCATRGLRQLQETEETE